jgi:hypothetical protein
LRRPGQTESRSEIFVVGLHFTPREELRLVESRESRIGKRIRRLTGSFVAQAQRQRGDGVTFQLSWMKYVCWSWSGLNTVVPKSRLALAKGPL